MASEAEVDIVVSTAGALPNLERDLSRIVDIAENNADRIDLETGLNTVQSLRQLDAQLSTVVGQVEGRIDGIEVGVLIEQRDAVRTLTRQLDTVTRAAGNGADPVSIQGVLDSAQTIRTVESQLRSVARNIERDIPPIEVDVDVDRNRLRNAASELRNIGSTALSVAGSIGRLGLSVGAAGVAVGALVPVLAAAAAAAAQIAPAAAIATSGMLAMQLASGTLKIAMIGVEEAIEAAFDPDAKPEELEKALKRLSPEARKFVVELRGMRSGLRAVQQEVQNRFFKDFDETLKATSRATLPALRKGLNDSADALNAMARGAAQSARELAEDGTLGDAINGASKALENLSGVPGQIVKSLGQLAAASAPALDKLTRRIDSKSTEIADKLTKAFETKQMEDAINKAFATIGQLFDSLGNILSGLGNIFGGLTQEGRGLFDILEDITQAFEDLTASEEFQLILGELAKTADTLVKNILPLLQEAFVQLAPVIEELGPVVREFITAIGPELIPLLQDLGPVLLDIAKIMKEQLPTAIMLTKGLIGVLSLAFQALHFVLEEIVIPIVRGVTRVLNSDLFNALSAGNLIVGLFTGQTEQRFKKMAPGVGVGIKETKRIIEGWAADLGNRILGQIQSFVDRVAIRFFRLVGEIRSAFSSLPGQMIQVGQNIVNGIIRGLTSSVGGLLSLARGIAERISSTINSALDIGSPSKVMIRTGKDTGAGLEIGLRSMIPKIESAAADMASVITPSFALPGGQSLALPSMTVGAPSVTVFIGNEQLDARTDARIDRSNQARDRVLSGGIRR